MSDMHDEFEKYRRMHASGVSPCELYLAAKAQGLDQISLLRLLRSACNLSLEDAKKVSGAVDAWVRKQEPRPGELVYWEGAASGEGFYFMQARVTRIADGFAFVEEQKKYVPTSSGLQEVEVSSPLDRIKLSYFDKPLVDRFSEALEFWTSLAGINATQPQ